MRRSLAFALGLLLLFPAGVVGVQLVQVADSKGCPARLTPSSGPLKVHLTYEVEAQRQALDLKALAGYVADRVGRQVQVVGLSQGDETGFRLGAAARPFSDTVLIFLAYRASFSNVPTAHGMVEALGFATPGTACAYVSFIPQPTTACAVGGKQRPIQPAYAYLTHEVGHLMGLAHSASGLMGRGVFDLCSGDTFTEAQQAALRAWGRA